MNPLERSKHPRAINDQIANYRKLTHRPQLDPTRRLGEQLVDQRRTRLPSLAINEHRALTSIVQAPQTSSRQLQSQATGEVLLPSEVVACVAIFCNTLITLRFGS